ncbi:MAG TPA: YggS family pyridoxal phosphate-dependent enzyme, partial [Dehalococcoidia bacterium]|nr:YggS family pyridoxal phosphate-dependent enzyme [Dehalococcoidia bacterium]
MAAPSRPADMTSSTISIASRIWEVRDGIERACARVGRPPDAVTLIAISKTQPAEAIIEAAAAGIVDFGENRIQEALPKIPILQSSSGGPVRFHFVGHLQKNKAALAAANFESVHSVDSPRLVQALGRAADDESSLEVFLQVNVSGEESKFGVA